MDLLHQLALLAYQCVYFYNAVTLMLTERCPCDSCVRTNPSNGTQLPRAIWVWHILRTKDSQGQG
eukprot:11140162-Prorocentrum_lima.AAC.1